MLIIKYDPINGKVISDGLIKDWADRIAKDYEEVIHMDITVGSGVMVDAARVLIMKEKLDYKEVIYRFKKLNLEVNKNGRLPVWPKGFCDVYDNMLEELVGIKE